jgi:hypothetical protein
MAEITLLTLRLDRAFRFLALFLRATMGTVHTIGKRSTEYGAIHRHVDRVSTLIVEYLGAS